METQSSNLEPHPLEIMAAVFEGPGADLSLRRFDSCQLEEGDILVKVEACTICGSDLHTFRGLRKEKTPTILGHEAIGRIEKISRYSALDSERESFNVGDRITWSVCVSCQNCDRCDNNLPQKCRHLRKFGHEQVFETGPFFGGLSNYVVLPKSTSMFKIPDDLNPEIICPSNCATATVMACMEKAGNVANKKVLVLGAGLLGLTAVAYLKSRDAGQVTLVDPNKSRLRMGRQFGAQETICQLHELANSTGESDIVFDFAGSTDAIQDSIDQLAIGGSLVIAGTVMPSENILFNPETLVRNLNLVCGVHNYRPEHLKQAISFLAENGSRFPFQNLVEKTFSLNQINDAFQYALSNKPVRVMIQP